MLTKLTSGIRPGARRLAVHLLAGITVGLGTLMPTSAHGQATQLAEPDTTSEVKQTPRVVEPRRQTRAVSRQQRIVAIRYALAEEGVDQFSASLPELVHFANQETQFDDVVFVDDEASLSDPNLGNPLLLYLSGNTAQLKLGAREKLWLGGYLMGGGLLFAEDVRPPALFRSDVARSGTPFDRQLKALLADGRVLGDAGQAWRTIGHDHPVYQAFFEFPGGPTLGTSSGRRWRSGSVTELEMLEIRGRVAVVFSDLNISYGWASMEATGRRRALQFGTNLLVFALAEQRAGPPR